MEPLNKKERTESFLKFLSMFILVIVFAVIGVYFDKVFFRKDYKTLKERLKNTEQANNFIPELSDLVDSTRSAVKMLSYENPDDFNAWNMTINVNYLQQLNLTKREDTTEVDNFKNKIKLVYDDWINDRRKLLQIEKLKKDIDKNDRIIKKLKQMLTSKGFTDDVVDEVIKVESM